MWSIVLQDRRALTEVRFARPISAEVQRYSEGETSIHRRRIEVENGLEGVGPSNGRNVTADFDGT